MAGASTSDRSIHFLLEIVDFHDSNWSEISMDIQMLPKIHINNQHIFSMILVALKHRLKVPTMVSLSVSCIVLLKELIVTVTRNFNSNVSVASEKEYFLIIILHACQHEFLC